ncbi:MAG: hypothetical protein ACK4GW_01225 [Pseudorhodobacter sp.]
MTGDDGQRLHRIAGLLDLLVRMDLPPEAHRLIAEAHALCPVRAQETRRGDDQDIDPAVLDQILALVGPDDAKALIDRLGMDLIQCRDGLRNGLEALDWPSMRIAAHNLVSLSGTAGADPLRRMAIGLVASCELQDTAAVQSALPPLLQRLGHLLDHLRRKSGTQEESPA